VESISVQLDAPIDEATVHAAYNACSSIRVLDDRTRSVFPSSNSADGGDYVDVGHFRIDDRTVSLIAAGDQLRVGAALNAVQIAMRLPS
jgi:aspartate-semialdehyde dehydrogenase